MNKLLSALTLCSGLFCSAALAHSEHGIISGQAAISIANKSLAQMTFKDFGFQVGKLDSSWKSLTSSDMSVVNVEDSFYVVSAINNQTNSTIYFKIANNGQVLHITDKNDF